MTHNRDGQVVTFYSYKGGTGRTMALANVAWILAANGKRVLMVDWDLESPGLDRFFTPFMDPNTLSSTNGVIELIREYEWEATRNTRRDGSWHEEYARVHKYSFSLGWPYFPAEAALDFLTAGRQNRDYATAIAGMNWDDFYDRQGGGAFFDALRADMKRHYDYTLIDSRTGLSDVADICTIHLPDTVVDCFTLSEQSIAGAAQIADLVRMRTHREIRILPVAMRVDPARKSKADAGLAVAKQRFEHLPDGMGDAERDTYWSTMQIPYQANYGYEESLAAFGDVPGASGSLLSHYEILTRYLTRGTVTALPPIDNVVRRRVNDRFIRRPDELESEVVLRYAPRDQPWAEWIGHLLVNLGVRVLDPWARPETAPGPTTARELRIVSRPDDAPDAGGAGPGRDPLVVCVADIGPLLRIAPINLASIADRSAAAAATQVGRLVGHPRADVDPAWLDAGPRFPGLDPALFHAPARNQRFTGRDDILRQIRARLTADRVRTDSVSTVVIRGMGGLGKTHVAMEFAHRYRGAYNVVYWIAAEPFAFVDSQLIDLGHRLGQPTGAGGPDTVRAVLDALNHESRRWLLVFDGAEDQRLDQFRPTGRGHVLITARGPLWNDRAATVRLDVFERAESVALLRQRRPGLADDEADQVAQALGDLPIAVAAAGAWLAQTAGPVEPFLRQLELGGPDLLPTETDPETSVAAATWSRPLRELRERSPAAHRLLQLCSVLASEIAPELVHSDALASLLVPFDPSVAEPILRGILVRQLTQLALLRLDRTGTDPADPPRRNRIVMHRLLQALVRARMAADELEHTRHEIHQALAELRPDGDVDDPDTWPRLRRLWPHVEASGAVRCPDEKVMRLVVDRVRYLWLRGHLDRGRRFAEETDQAWSHLLARTTDPADRRRIEVQLHLLRFNHANILRSLGLFAVSRAVDEQTLAGQVGLIGREHPHALMTAGGLSGDLRGLGRYQQALALDERTYAAWRDAFGDDHPRTLAALNNLATSYRLVGQFRPARERDTLAYERRRVVLGDDHPGTFSSAANLGRDLREAGEYAASITLLRLLLTATTQAFGARSREALTVQANLAVSLRSAGHAVEAGTLLDEAARRLGEGATPASPDARAAQLSRAVNLIALREFSLAGRELQDAHEGYEQTLGPDHPHTLACVTNLGVLARATGDGARATQLSRQALAAFTTVLGPAHPYTVDTATNLAIALAEQGEPLAAHDQLSAALPRITQIFGPEHPVTLRARANLGLIARDVADGRVLDQLIRALSAVHPAVIDLREGRFVPRLIDPHPF